MNYKKLGSTDVDVSTICLGTMTWGEQNSKADGFEQMDYAIDNGVNFWDTAEIYAIPMREETCLLYTSPSPRDGLLSRMPSSA